MDAVEHTAWYRGSKDTQPFKLSRVVTSNTNTFHCLACYPWTFESLNTLWGGTALQDPSQRTQWETMSKEWLGAIAIGATGRLLVLPKLGTVGPIQVTLPDANSEVSNVTWALSQLKPTKPLIVFTVTSVVMIYDVSSRSLVGKLRGHGGHIKSLTTHPLQPHLFCTTSRDFTARIYNVSLQPVQTPNNPHWLPNREPSLAGPAHGLHMCEPEGEGIGQCVAVMVGGRSGGHRAAVLCSAFHPSQPLIATGGVDRAVKIWRIPPSVFSPPPPESPRLAREDKPLFSTDLLHKAHVLTLTWLADDVLASCCAPALMRYDQDDPEETYWEEGTVVVWQWLSFNRFFPVGKLPQEVMRGTASDWRNSESFKILSAYHLPMPVKHTGYYCSPHHDPVLLVPMGKVIHIFNISQFQARIPPKFPLDDLALLTGRMRLDDDDDDSEETTRASIPSGKDDTSDDANVIDKGKGRQIDEAVKNAITSMKYPPPAPLQMLFDSVEGWEVVAESQRRDGGPEMADITMCTMGFEGSRIVAIGRNGTLYIWRLTEGGSSVT